MPVTAPTITAEDVLEEIAVQASIERTAGNLHDATQLLSLINVAQELAERSAKDASADGPLARELRGVDKALVDLSDRGCNAISEYGDRHHPHAQIMARMRSAVGELAVAS